VIAVLLCTRTRFEMLVLLFRAWSAPMSGPLKIVPDIMQVLGDAARKKGR
jgi:hypothetical protein